MKIGYWLIIGGAALASLQGFGATYELIRLTTAHNKTADEYVIRCYLHPGSTTHATEIGGITAEQSQIFKTDEAKIQKLADAVKGIDRPDFETALEYTNWWVRTNQNEPAKLLRSNLTYKGGQKILEDKSPAAKTLSSFMGLNCLRSFGQ